MPKIISDGFTCIHCVIKWNLFKWFYNIKATFALMLVSGCVCGVRLHAEADRGDCYHESNSGWLDEWGAAELWA